MPKFRDTYKHVFLSVFITLVVIVLTFFNVDVFLDYSTLSTREYWDALNLLYLNNYYVHLLNLCFLFFIWYIYNQELFVLSEYLSSALAIHTLMVVNEVYQLYNQNHFITNFIDGLYFNFIIYIAFALVWVIRLYYIATLKNKEDENYVLNYDVLKGFVDKKRSGVWISLLIKIGRRNIIAGSLLLFALICIPLIFIGELNIYNKVNIVLVFVFSALVIIYAIIYTQRKWYSHIGFLFKSKK
jgi:hypothetical protein